MLPWEKKKCGKTSTEECLARYVCCIDDYCCKPCEDPLTCVPDCLPGTDGCCCEGKICNAGTCEPGPPTCVDPLTCDPVSICTTPGQDGCCCDGKICNAGTCEPGPPTCVDPLTCDPVSICTTPGQDGCCCDGKICNAGTCECPACFEPLCGDDGTCCTDGTSETCNDGDCVACDTGGSPDTGVTCEDKQADPFWDPCCYPNQCKDIANGAKSKCGCDDTCNPAPGDCTFGYDYVCCPNGKICGNDNTCVDSGGPGCETAFALADEPSLSSDFCTDSTFTRWGWTNGPYTTVNTPSPGAELKMYAGAGQCDITKGTEVGAATVEVDGSTVTVTFTPTMDAFEFTEFHVQVSCDPLKYAPGPTVAPGQYTVIGGPTGTGDTTTITFGENGNPIDGTCESTASYWVIIHAVSCPYTPPPPPV